jgi:hypothetical protein
MSDENTPATPVIAQILRTLIEEYGSALHLPAGNNAIAKQISGEARIAHGTVLAILNGTPQRIAVNTGNRLAEFFNRAAIPRLRGEWFSSTSLEDFNTKRGAAGAVAIKVPPDHQRLIGVVEHWLCGVHIVYRYSLDSIHTGDVSREVLQIRREGAGLTHKMSFVPRAGQDKDPIYYFEGPVILAGRTATLLGMNIGKPTQDRTFDRVRMMIFDHDDANGGTHNCKIGIMTSTRPRVDYAPCTASTFMIRAQWETGQVSFDDLVKSATTIRPLNDTIREDFGSKHGAPVRAFLDNRPSGTQREPELQEYEMRVPEGSYDRVLRIDTARFSLHMPLILADVMNDDAICAPFKPNWLAKMRER